MKLNNYSTDVKRILVVEDEPVITQVCVRVLNSEGFETDIAVDGKVALGMIEEKQYDLCLIDIRTPTMDGKGLYKWIKDNHPQLLGGVIFTTGDVMSDDNYNFIDQVGRPFLLKPFTPDQLRTMVREIAEEVE